MPDALTINGFVQDAVVSAVALGRWPWCCVVCSACSSGARQSRRPVRRTALRGAATAPRGPPHRRSTPGK